MWPGSAIAAASAVGQVVEGRGSAFAARRRSARGRHRRPPAAAAADRVEVERQLEALAAHRPGPDRAARAPAGRTLGPDPGRGHRPARGDLAEGLDLLDRRLARDRRQPLDERPELVLAEEADDRVAVVVAEAGGLEVELDGQVADDPRQRLALVDLVAVLAQLLAELVGLDLLDPGVERVEVAELGDELRRRLLPHPGDARDVVGRVPLEGLVVDHLVGPQPEPLPDPGRIVDDRVLDAGAGRHQPRPVGHELEHVEVDGHDRRLEVARRRPGG